MIDFIVKSLNYFNAGFVVGAVVMVVAVALQYKIPILKRWFDKFDE
jgi:hypothetical protein